MIRDPDPPPPPLPDPVIKLGDWNFQPVSLRSISLEESSSIPFNSSWTKGVRDDYIHRIFHSTTKKILEGQKPQTTDNSKLFALFDHSNFRPKTANISDKCYKYFRVALGLYFTKMFAPLWIAWVLFHVEEWKFYSTVYFGHFVQAGQSSDPQRSNAVRVRNMNRFNGGKLPGNSKHFFQNVKR